MCFYYCLLPCVAIWRKNRKRKIPAILFSSICFNGGDLDSAKRYKWLRGHAFMRCYFFFHGRNTCPFTWKQKGAKLWDCQYEFYSPCLKGLSIRRISFKMLSLSIFFRTFQIFMSFVAKVAKSHSTGLYDDLLLQCWNRPLLQPVGSNLQIERRTPSKSNSHRNFLSMHVPLTRCFPLCRRGIIYQIRRAIVKLLFFKSCLKHEMLVSIFLNGNRISMTNVVIACNPIKTLINLHNFRCRHSRQQKIVYHPLPREERRRYISRSKSKKEEKSIIIITITHFP